MSFSNKIVTTYAKSLFQNLKTAKLKKQDEIFKVGTITSSDQKNFIPDVFILGEELLLIRSIIISSKKIEEFFKNPTYQEQQKLEIILNIFPGLTLTMKSFLKVLTERNHLSLLPLISEQYNNLLIKFKNVTKVKIILSSTLEDTFGDSLLTTLKKITNSSDIILNVAYNPKLLGGLILEYNSVAIDASILKEFSLFFTEI
jgi:ATP synthase F1 delta subunit